MAKIRSLSFKEKLMRHRAKKWTAQGRSLGRRSQESKILKGIRGWDDRVFSYDEPGVHDRDSRYELPEGVVPNTTDKKSSPIRKGKYTPRLDEMPWDNWDVEQTSDHAPYSWGADVDSDDFGPEGKPEDYDEDGYWPDGSEPTLDDIHAERVWRAVEKWTEKARQESWPTD